MLGVVWGVMWYLVLVHWTSVRPRPQVTCYSHPLWPRISSAKQRPQGTSCNCSHCGICRQKLKKCHRTFLISVFARSIEVPLTRVSGASAVAKTGVSLVISMSRLQKFLGAGRCIESPSRSCRRSAHAIMEGFQWKSLRKITSASSAPTHVNVPVAGLEKILYMTLRGERIKVFLEFAGPWM